ncbi:hypothetical protein OA433_01270 [Candidatus Pelagibacter sp.]|nr:hypothetical protein [Candidatus Pelagibacter sp.]
MKKFLGILVLGLLLSLNAKADNISDFQIEGISIGDSLLKYYSEKDIKKSIAKKQGYKDKSFVRGVICKSEATHSFCKVKKDLTTYDAIQFHFKKRDKEYKIFMLSGIKDFIGDIDGCKIEKSKAVEQLVNIFPNARQDAKENPHPQDKSNKSIVYSSYFFLGDESASRVQCYDWSKKTKRPDYLKVTLDHPEYIDWIKNKAWK